MTRIGIACLIVLVSFAGEALASCPLSPELPPCQEYWRADAVFIGVAKRVGHVQRKRENIEYVQSTAYLTVEEAFKGVEGPEVVFDATGCGYEFKEGERYLVYAYLDSLTKRLEVRVNTSRTRPLSQAADDLQYIRGLSSPEAGTRVFGKVEQVSYNIKERNWAFEPLQNIKVTLEGTNPGTEVITDSQGRYEFKQRLPAGTYRVRAEITAYRGRAEKTIKAIGRGCVQADFSAHHEGVITGRILDTNGNPRPSAFIRVPKYPDWSHRHR